MDLRISHERGGSCSDLNGHLHYPNDVSPLCLLFLVRLGVYIVNLWVFYSYRIIGKLTTFLQFQEFNLRNMTVDYSTSVSRRSPRWHLHGNILVKDVTLRVNLNLDGTPITSRTHTHPLVVSLVLALFLYNKQLFFPSLNNVTDGVMYETIGIFNKFQDRCPPPSDTMIHRHSRKWSTVRFLRFLFVF